MDREEIKERKDKGIDMAQWVHNYVIIPKPQLVNYLIS